MLLRLSIINAVGGEGSNDTGKATLSNVAITKLGSTNSDGTSLTVTYSDGSTMSANKANNEILNNDEVVYEASYNITTPGTITLSFTMPANNVIDEASVSEAAGCGAGSKLEQVTVDGKQSYTNNKAICVINPDSSSTSTTVWTIRTNPWGGNNEQIQPTLAISGQTQSQQPTPIKTVGKGDYGMEVVYSDSGGGAIDGGAEMQLRIRLFAFNTIDGMPIGISPIDGNSFTLGADTVGLPRGWYTYDSWVNLDNGVGTSGGNDDSVVWAGAVAISNEDNGARLSISFDGAAVGVLHCPVQTSAGTPLASNKCYYTGATIQLVAPATSLTDTTKRYSMQFDDYMAMGNGTMQRLNVSPISGGWNLSNRGSAQPTIRLGYNIVGWENYWGGNQPVYPGERINDSTPVLVTNVVIGSTEATNLNYCLTWNPSAYKLVHEMQKSGGGIILGDYGVEYGVIGADPSTTPSSAQVACGRYGDGSSAFFKSLAEAEQYARNNNMQVNAMRLWSARTRAGLRDGRLGRLIFAVVAPSRPTSSTATFGSSATSDQWNSDWNRGFMTTLVPGLLSHALTVEPSSINPGKEDHITITTKTYNKDTNSKITTTLPTNTYPTNNSFTITDPNGTKHTLVEGDGQDYTMAGTCSPTTSATQPASTTPCTITFNLDHIATTYHTPITGYDPILPGQSGTTDGSNTTINPTIEQGGDGLPIAADNNGNGITHSTTPIEFDILVDSNVPTPSTLSITSQASGTGTNYASSTFRSATASLAVATRKEFSYSLSSNASSIYASDPLSYTLSNTNTLDSTVNNLTTINVLPYDGDSNGTTGLTSYTVTNLSLDPSTATNAQLLYTTSPIARQLEQTDPAALAGQSTNSANNTLASSIEWTKCNLDSNGSCTNLPTTNPDTTTTTTTSNITAIKYLASTLPSGSHPTVRYTLSNLVFNNGEEGNIDSNSNNTQLVNAITYTMADILPSPVTQVSPVTTTYLGSLLSMSLDKATLSTNLASNSVAIGNGDLANPDSLTNVLNLTAKTNHGYTITLAVPDTNSNLTNTVNNQAYTIPTINTKPTKGTPGWAVAIPPTTTTTTPTNLTWHSLPNTTSPAPLAIYQTSTGGTTNLKLPITYGIATAQNTIAGPYTARVVYTVVGE